MKKMTFLLLIASLILLSACSSNSEKAATTTDSGKKEITVWAWDPNFNIAALKLAKDRYVAKHPDVTVNIVEYAQNDIVQKMNAGLNSGSTKGLPNVVLIEDYRAQNFLQAYPDSFHDMSSTIKASDFADYKIGPTSYNGKQYGVPFDSGVMGLYVRTDYLEQAGYKVADLTNIDWDKFIEIGKAVKQKTGKEMLTQDPNDLGLIRGMIQTAGSWYLKEDGKTPNLAGNPALKEALLTYKSLFDANIVKMNADWSQFLAAFNSGAVASVPTGNWITPSIKAEASQSGKWAVVPFPKLKNIPESVNASSLGGSSWYVLNSDGQDTAADFLKETFGTDQELYQDMLSKIGIVGSLNAASSGKAYDVEDPYFGGDKVYKKFAEWTKQVPKVNYGLHTYAIEDIMTVEIQNYLNGKDVDAVLKDAQGQAEAQLK
ncbi:ABC transporter substrate-binding protein [Paenibacillus peoriae]|jgi:lactose/L-arabinose transport system substrate-binding protein|uniref:Extracellular solute-binding protein n=3 Tax=Paenibacillus TaxID=44249 RepID=A0AAC9KMP2_PAEPO|nr:MULTISPECIES: extracellular solute-binding protein [Paenibacillus]ALA40247.1 ABC transporter substrate-binding protein [Paenibacillus peoriae]APB73065.1 maltose/maltodextrin ABC transporter substrate-binding protein MalE [Paenibacillus polymyxa]APQ57474.1 ABC transporter substrate-binding protein [Paenibacillus polymyxa]MBP1174136.1 lactose/L-arabinose transport system substrate-binding protein [Paenibacillus sp. PvR133]MDY7992748.1 extracellular solute-binding protein [Paenibacillus polymy